MSSYVLVTPAHNEQDFIEKTIQSVISQTCPPLQWVIVSDRSTDNTDAIVKQYEARYDFIKFIRKDRGDGRDTAAKVMAINRGLEYLARFDYNFIGNLDADISFDPDYFEKLLNIFQNNASLGLIGGRIYHLINGKPVENKASMESVAGAVQFFRKECFEKIGGYVPLKGGLEDSVAELAARYHGWRTLSIKNMVVIHYRDIGTVSRSIWLARFNDGINEYIFDYSYPYHLMRLVYYLPEKPMVIGSIITFSGYLYALLARKRKILPSYLKPFHRREQRERVLGRFFSKT